MKIAIAGYGVEGQESYNYWSKDPANDITIVDQNEQLVAPDGVKTILGENAFENINGFDLVIRTPGLAPYKITTDSKIWSGTNEFFAKCPAEIIGVTGSKGKGTTSSLIASILEAAGRKVWLVGNIGISALEVLDQIQPEDVVVYELSSFQLWDIEKSPQTAVILLIEPDHLDVHRSMEEYVAAKANITMFQSPDDVLVFNGENEYTRSIAAQSKAQKIGFPEQGSAHVQDGQFAYGEHIICSTDVLQIPGPHNVSNTLAAIDATWKFTQDVDAITKGLHEFKGLKHRLSFVREIDNVSYYDDSIATTPGSAIAALRAFDVPKVIILGGSSKGSDFTELAAEVLKHDVQAILIGDEAQNIEAAFKQSGFEKYETIDQPTMSRIVTRASELAKPGSVVLLSPSAASFGLFKNYADRGDQFIAAVNEL
jgi:UDP-N-acetylmuramoylalanine--D-glutamate ligase